jgi:hypothetical protein
MIGFIGRLYCNYSWSHIELLLDKESLTVVWFSEWSLVSPIVDLLISPLSLSPLLRPTASRPVCLRINHQIWSLRPDLYYCQTFAGLLMWGALSDERTGLSFTTTAGPRQCSHSRVLVPWDSRPYFTVSNSRLSQPGRPGPRIYIPQERGGPVIFQGTGFPFRRLLRVAELRWSPHA